MNRTVSRGRQLGYQVDACNHDASDTVSTAHGRTFRPRVSGVTNHPATTMRATAAAILGRIFGRGGRSAHVSRRGSPLSCSFISSFVGSGALLGSRFGSRSAGRLGSRCLQAPQRARRATGAALATPRMASTSAKKWREKLECPCFPVPSRTHFDPGRTDTPGYPRPPRLHPSVTRRRHRRPCLLLRRLPPARPAPPRAAVPRWRAGPERPHR